jgi:hypothetical protein
MIKIIPIKYILEIKNIFIFIFLRFHIYNYIFYISIYIKNILFKNI